MYRRYIYIFPRVHEYLWEPCLIHELKELRQFAQLTLSTCVARPDCILSIPWSQQGDDSYKVSMDVSGRPPFCFYPMTQWKSKVSNDDPS